MRFIALDLDLPALSLGDARNAGIRAAQIHLAIGQMMEYCLNFATASFVFAYSYVLAEPWLADLSALPTQRHLLAANVLFSTIVIVMLHHVGAYRASSGLLRVRETSCVLQGCLFAMLMIAPSALLLTNLRAMLFLAIAFPALTLLLVIEKNLFHNFFEAYQKRGLGLKRALIYGSGVTGKRLFSILSRSPRLGMLPIAVVDPSNNAPGDTGATETSRALLSHLEEEKDTLGLPLLRTHRADIVLVVPTGLSRAQVLEVLTESKQANVQVAFVADLASDYTGPVSLTELDGDLLYGTTSIRTSLLHHSLSRTLDIAFSLLILIATAPLWLLVSVLVRLDSSGPVLFKQVRVGKDGKLFTILKFRSMHTVQCGDDLSPTHSSDTRITRVGRILRKTSIDELPQLLNILRGDMALVGPRPEMPFIVAMYTEEHRRRLTVRPGLTGLWQISADRGQPIHENIHYDLYYLRNRSIYIDLAILFHTALFAMKGI